MIFGNNTRRLINAGLPLITLLGVVSSCTDVRFTISKRYTELYGEFTEMHGDKK